MDCYARIRVCHNLRSDPSAVLAAARNHLCLNPPNGPHFACERAARQPGARPHRSNIRRGGDAVSAPSSAANAGWVTPLLTRSDRVPHAVRGQTPPLIKSQLTQESGPLRDIRALQLARHAGDSHAPDWPPVHIESDVELSWRQHHNLSARRTGSGAARLDVRQEAPCPISERRGGYLSRGGVLCAELETVPRPTELLKLNQELRFNRGSIHVAVVPKRGSTAPRQSRSGPYRGGAWLASRH